MLQISRLSTLLALTCSLSAQDAVAVTTGADGVPEVAIAGRLTVDGSQILPPGMLMPYAGVAGAPAGWLLCDGSAVSRTSYAELFAVIGTAYGAGDGSTTFNLPDLRGRMPLGSDAMGGSAAGRIHAAAGMDGQTIGAAGGSSVHTLTIAEMPRHGHDIDVRRYNDAGVGSIQAGWAGSGMHLRRSRDEGGDQPHNNMPPCLVVHYLIKH